MRLALRRKSVLATAFTLWAMLMLGGFGSADNKAPPRKPGNKKPAQGAVPYPPKLPGGKEMVSDTSAAFLKPPPNLKEGVKIAKAPPRVDFLFYPGQDYPARPWSNWGDGCVANGKYYSAIGDHLAIGSKGDGSHGTGTGYVFEFDPETKTLKQIVNTSKVLKLPKGHYTPGKIHSRVDMGSDGWLYFATHRGSKRATTDQYQYKGDWILRCNPKTGKCEVVVQAPVPNHAIPTSVLDPDRLIFYGATAAGLNAKDQDIRFFAYDIGKKKLLYSGPDGPSRYVIFARSTGLLYYVPGKEDGPLMRFDPRVGGAPVKVKGSRIGVRAATRETKDGYVYTVSKGQRTADADVWSFNTKTEKIKKIGTVAVGSRAYVASIDVEPTGRYLYYVPGAHGSSLRDGTPVVQFDVKTGRKKVLAFLNPFYQKKYGFSLKGTYSTAVGPRGEKLYVTWNVSRGSRAWDSCGLTVIHIPESERQGAKVGRLPFHENSNGSPATKRETTTKPRVSTTFANRKPLGPPAPDGVSVLAFDATVRKPAPFAKWTTGDIAPKPDQLVLLWIGISRTTGPVNVPTVSGAGIKWKLENTLDVNGGPRRLCLFSGISSRPTKGPLRINFNGQKQQRAFWAAVQFRDAKSVGQVAMAPDSTARDGSGEVNFSRLPTGPVAAFVLGSIRSDIVPPTGMHELGELNAVHRIEAAYSPKPLKQIRWTWQRGVHYIAIGAELNKSEPARRK